MLKFHEKSKCVLLKNKPKTIYLPLLLLSFNAIAESDFSVETILSGQQITQFALGDTNGDGRDEIVFLDQYGTMKIARNFANPNSLNMLTNTRWNISENWKLQFLDQAYPSSDIRVNMTYEQMGTCSNQALALPRKEMGR